MIIKLKEREKTGGHSAHQMRGLGEVPVVVYGQGVESRSFSLPESVATKLLREQGTSSLLDIEVPGSTDTQKVIVHDWQSNPLTGRIEHMDFYQVRMDKALHTEIALEFIGISPAVKDLGGILVKQMTQVPIECLPNDLVHNISVDISALKVIDDSLRVKDLVLPAGIKIRLDAEDMIVSVASPRSEAEISALSEATTADVSAVEVIGAKKEDEASKEEGAKDAKEENTAKK